MTMPSLTFLDKTSILIPRSKAFLTRPRYCLPFLCRDKEWRNDAFHELVSRVCMPRWHIVYRKSFVSNEKSIRKCFKVYFKNPGDPGSTSRRSETWNNWETLRRVSTTTAARAPGLNRMYAVYLKKPPPITFLPGLRLLTPELSAKILTNHTRS